MTAPKTYVSAGKKNRRHIKGRRPTAQNQKKQILRNQNQITAIKRTLREHREPVTWQCGFVDATFNPVQAPLIVPLTNGPGTAGSPAVLNNTDLTPVDWTYTMSPALQNSPLNRSKCFLNTQYLDISIKSGSEARTQQYTAYIVSLQEATAQDTYNQTTNMTLLTRDQHYCCPNNSGVTTPSFYGAYLNPRAFKIHKKFVLMTQSTADEAISSVARNVTGVKTNQVNRIVTRLSYGNTKLMVAGENVAGATNDRLDSLSYDDIAPDKKKFLVIFTDDTDEDAQHSRLTMSSIITGSCA